MAYSILSTNWEGYPNGQSVGDIIMTSRAQDEVPGSYNSSTGWYTVPENGRYEFMLHLVSYSTSSLQQFYIELYLDDKIYDTMRRRTYPGSSYYDDSTENWLTEIDARKGSIIKYKVTNQYHYTRLSRRGCYYNGNEVGCSYIQGRLKKRLSFA